MYQRRLPHLLLKSLATSTVHLWMRSMVFCACVQYEGLCLSSQDTRLLMVIGMSTWNMYLKRGTLYVMKIWKRRKQQKWKMLDPLEKNKCYNWKWCQGHRKAYGHYLVLRKEVIIILVHLVLHEVVGQNIIIPPQRKQRFKLLRSFSPGKYPNTRNQFFSTHSMLKWVQSPIISLDFMVNAWISLQKFATSWEVSKEQKIM